MSLLNKHTFGKKVSGGGGAPTVFDAGISSTAITISNGGLTITNDGGAFSTAFATNPKTTGKHSFEVTVVGGIQQFTGLANPNNTLYESDYMRYSPNVAWFGNTRFYYNNASYASIGGTYTVGDIITVGVDLDTNKFYGYKNGVIALNGTAWTTAFDSTTPAHIGCSLTGSYTSTFNFGATGVFTYPIAGFTPWDG